MTTRAAPNEALEHAAELIRSGKARKIAVLTGAGISTSAGIPDFRSPGTGLYDNLQALKLPMPEAVFVLDYFRMRPEPFWTLAKDLYPGKYYPTPTHYFLALLHKKGVLQRVWSQNIDTLETAAGVPPEQVVEAHGSFRTAHCLACRAPASTEHVLTSGVRRGAVVKCEDGCGGLVKPDIVFFGEGLPENFFRLMPEISKADLVIVLGTSLQVYPFAGLLDEVAPGTPRLLINREAVGPFTRMKHGKRKGRDGVYLGDADEAALALADAIGWRAELDEMISKGRAELERDWAEKEGLGKQPKGAAKEAAHTESKAAKADKGKEVKAAVADDDKKLREVQPATEAIREAKEAGAAEGAAGAKPSKTDDDDVDALAADLKKVAVDDGELDGGKEETGKGSAKKPSPKDGAAKPPAKSKV